MKLLFLAVAIVALVLADIPLDNVDNTIDTERRLERGQVQTLRSQPGQDFNLKCQQKHGVNSISFRRSPTQNGQGEQQQQQNGGDHVIQITCVPVASQELLVTLSEQQCRTTEETTLAQGITFQDGCQEQEILTGVASRHRGQDGQRTIQLRCCQIQGLQQPQELKYDAPAIDMWKQAGTIDPQLPHTTESEEQQQKPRQIIQTLQINRHVAVARYAMVQQEGQQSQDVQRPQNSPPQRQEINQLPQLEQGQFSQPGQAFVLRCGQQQAVTGFQVKQQEGQGGQGGQGQMGADIATSMRCQEIQGLSQTNGKNHQRITAFGNQHTPLHKGYGCLPGEMVSGLVSKISEQDGTRVFALICKSNGQLQTQTPEQVTQTITQQAKQMNKDLMTLQGQEAILQTAHIEFDNNNQQNLVRATYAKFQRQQNPNPSNVPTDTNDNDDYPITPLENEIVLDPTLTGDADLVDTLYIGQPKQGIMGNIGNNNGVFTCNGKTALTAWQVSKQQTVDQQGVQPSIQYVFKCTPITQPNQLGQTGREQCRFTQDLSLTQGFGFNSQANCQNNEYLAGAQFIPQNQQGQHGLRLKCCRTPNVQVVQSTCYDTQPQVVSQGGETVDTINQQNQGDIFGQNGQNGQQDILGGGQTKQLINKVQVNQQGQTSVRYCQYQLQNNGGFNGNNGGFNGNNGGFNGNNGGFNGNNGGFNGNNGGINGNNYDDYDNQQGQMNGPQGQGINGNQQGQMNGPQGQGINGNQQGQQPNIGNLPQIPQGVQTRPQQSFHTTCPEGHAVRTVRVKQAQTQFVTGFADIQLQIQCQPISYQPGTVYHRFTRLHPVNSFIQQQGQMLDTNDQMQQQQIQQQQLQGQQLQGQQQQGCRQNEYVAGIVSQFNAQGRQIGLECAQASNIVRVTQGYQQTVQLQQTPKTLTAGYGQQQQGVPVIQNLQINANQARAIIAQFVDRQQQQQGGNYPQNQNGGLYPQGQNGNDYDQQGQGIDYQQGQGQQQNYPAQPDYSQGGQDYSGQPDYTNGGNGQQGQNCVAQRVFDLYQNHALQVFRRLTVQSPQTCVQICASQPNCQSAGVQQQGNGLNGFQGTQCLLSTAGGNNCGQGQNFQRGILGQQQQINQLGQQIGTSGQTVWFQCIQC